eukprot:GHVH01005492.1.p1 GENE.GHVH01005492.1~~GHVH01005492.1.p1  ORF type:complete len:549 (-),score=56.90 GHVH01005492.1:1625-3271(-)
MHYYPQDHQTRWQPPSHIIGRITPIQRIDRYPAAVPNDIPPNTICYRRIPPKTPHIEYVYAYPEYSPHQPTEYQPTEEYQATEYLAVPNRRNWYSESVASRGANVYSGVGVTEGPSASTSGSCCHHRRYCPSDSGYEMEQTLMPPQEKITNIRLDLHVFREPETEDIASYPNARCRRRKRTSNIVAKRHAEGTPEGDTQVPASRIRLSELQSPSSSCSIKDGVDDRCRLDVINEEPASYAVEGPQGVDAHFDDGLEPVNLSIDIDKSESLKYEAIDQKIMSRSYHSSVISTTCCNRHSSEDPIDCSCAESKCCDCKREFYRCTCDSTGRDRSVGQHNDYNWLNQLELSSSRSHDSNQFKVVNVVDVNSKVDREVHPLVVIRRNSNSSSIEQRPDRELLQPDGSSSDNKSSEKKKIASRSLLAASCQRSRGRKSFSTSMSRELIVGDWQDAGRCSVAPLSSIFLRSGSNYSRSSVESEMSGVSSNSTTASSRRPSTASLVSLDSPSSADVVDTEPDIPDLLSVGLSSDEKSILQDANNRVGIDLGNLFF